MVRLGPGTRRLRRSNVALLLVIAGIPLARRASRRRPPEPDYAVMRPVEERRRGEVEFALRRYGASDSGAGASGR